MREAELLSALARGKGGIYISMGRNVTVSTRYWPEVTGVGRTLMEAAYDCARWILDVVKDHPEEGNKVGEVLAALEDYDNHTTAMQV